MGLPVEIRLLQPQDWPWIYERAKPALCNDTNGVVATRGGTLLAAAVMDSWCESSCQGHIVIESPVVLRWDFLEKVFHYAFVIRGVTVILGMTPANNEKALKFNRKIGFREIYRVPDAYQPGVAFVLQEMRKAECRWLREEFRQVA